MDPLDPSDESARRENHQKNYHDAGTDWLYWDSLGERMGEGCCIIGGLLYLGRECEMVVVSGWLYRGRPVVSGERN